MPHRFDRVVHDGRVKRAPPLAGRVNHHRKALALSYMPAIFRRSDLSRREKTTAAPGADAHRARTTERVEVVVAGEQSRADVHHRLVTRAADVARDQVEAPHAGLSPDVGARKMDLSLYAATFGS